MDGNALPRAFGGRHIMQHKYFICPQPKNLSESVLMHCNLILIMKISLAPPVKQFSNLFCNKFLSWAPFFQFNFIFAVILNLLELVKLWGE